MEIVRAFIAQEASVNLLKAVETVSRIGMNRMWTAAARSVENAQMEKYVDSIQTAKAIAAVAEYVRTPLQTPLKRQTLLL